MAYITRTNPYASLVERPTLGALPANNGGTLDTMASSLGTPTSSFLLLLGGGAVAGWLANDLVTGTRKAVRKTSRAIGARASAARDTVSANPLPVAMLALLAGGIAYYYATHKTGGAA
ncbi:MAG: hypothetical protein CXZ00_03040 [Acidobacteria bacterium]|nr:MAG: hypothetical protein CXZ00_03040 [Acidobacteriota bacterium]